MPRRRIPIIQCALGQLGKRLGRVGIKYYIKVGSRYYLQVWLNNVRKCDMGLNIASAAFLSQDKLEIVYETTE